MRKEKTLQRVRQQRARRTRARISGSAERPRLSVFRSNRWMYVQLIDDRAHKTIASASTRELPKEAKKKKKTEQALLIGELLAQRAKEKGIKSAVFDRGSNKFHGRVQAFADGAKQGGLKI